MKKLILALGVLFLPFAAMAASDDVSITSNAVISVGGYNISLNGDSSVVESVTVNTSSFSVTLQSGSQLSVTSSDRLGFGTDAPAANIFEQQCQSGQSTLILRATSSVTVVVTPAGTCDPTTTTTTSSGGGNGPIVGSSGGGGGGGGYYSTPVVQTTTASTPVVTTTSTQSWTSHVFAITYGSSGKVDTKILQKVLNADPDTIVSSVGAGSPGKESTTFGPATKKAVQKFQIKYGISAPGKDGYGIFGPKTKAKVNEIAKLKGI